MSLWDDMTYHINKRTITDDYVMLFFKEDKVMVSVDDYFSYGIGNKNEIGEDVYEKLKERERIIKAYRSCLRKIAAKDHSVLQIRRHLRRFELEDEDREDIIDKLLAYHLLDDEQYALNRINALNEQNVSYKEIRNRLKKEGIQDQLIGKYLKEDDGLELEKARKVAEKYLRSHDAYSLNSKKKNLLNKLISASFSYELSRSLLDTLSIGNENELELLKKEYLKVHKRYSRKYEDYELKNRIIASLLSKGFQYQDIKEIMEEETDEND